MSKEYTSTITYASKELTAIEKVKLKNLQDAIQLDDAVSDDGSLYVKPELYAMIEVHNERSKNDKDYKKMVIIADDGTKYVTGSDSFMRSFEDIADDMEGDDTPWAIKIFRRPSKNYSGTFITCTITDVIA